MSLQGFTADTAFKPGTYISQGLRGRTDDAEVKKSNFSAARVNVI